MQFGLQRGACKNQLPFCSILVGCACGGVTGEESSQPGTVVFVQIHGREDFGDFEKQ